MILVVGASGMLGSEVCLRLRTKGQPVRALVRAGSVRRADLKAAGVELFTGDLRQPTSLQLACQGVEAVVSTATAVMSRGKGNTLQAVDRTGQLALVDAAKRSGVARFVYVSLSRNLPPICPIIRFKREVEQAIRTSDMGYTLLQPANLMEVWLGPQLGWDLQGGRAQVFGSGEQPVSWISARDVAEFAVAACASPATDKRELPLGGPEALAPLEVVRRWEKLRGRQFRVKKIPVGMLKAVLPVLRWAAPLPASLVGLAITTAEGDVIPMEQQQREYGVKLSSVEEFARRWAG